FAVRAFYRAEASSRAHANHGEECAIAGPPGRGSVMKTPEGPSRLTRIFLIGYRGAGKSTVARLLASRLGWKWTDADAALEERYRRGIGTMFAEEGEAEFRKKESAMLQELIRLDNYVVSTGGGIVLDKKNRDRLRTSGLVVWLTGEPKTLHQRMNLDPETSAR